jgi:gluconolactonase
VVDADGNLYAAHAGGGEVLKITPQGNVSEFAKGPDGRDLVCANYPAFDRAGNMYLSDSGDWSSVPNGTLLKIPPGGGAAQLWYPKPVDTPNAIALDADEDYLYFVETFGAAIARVAINADGSAGAFERVVHMPRHVPDGIAFDTQGRLWIACHQAGRDLRL